MHIEEKTHDMKKKTLLYAFGSNVTNHKNKKGLAGRFKVLGQIGVGIIVGSILYNYSSYS